MHRLSHLIAFYVATLIFLAAGFAVPEFADAQSVTKISVAERNNGTGYVIRVHMNKAPRGFDLRQPHPHGIELKLNDGKASLNRLRTGNPPHPVEHLRKVDDKNFAGLVFELSDDAYYISRAYMDANKRDILIALTTVSRAEAEAAALKQKGFGWVEPITSIPIATLPTTSNATQREKTTEAENTSTKQTAPPTNASSGGLTADEATLLVEDETFRRMRDNVRFDVVVIDAGHGGHDPGAIGFSKSKEKDIVLKTALKLGELIKKNMPDVKVIYTRDDDRFVSVPERGRIANRVQGDLFISIHCNAHRNRSAHGAEVYFLGKHRTDDALEVMLRENSVLQFEANNTETLEMTPEQLLAYELANFGNIASSEKMASYMIDEFKSHTTLHSRGVKQAGFWVLYHAAMPAVLVELGFISNKEEEAYLLKDQTQNKLAEAMFRAVQNYKQQYEKTVNVDNSVPVQRVGN